MSEQRARALRAMGAGAALASAGAAALLVVGRRGGALALFAVAVASLLTAAIAPDRALAVHGAIARIGHVAGQGILRAAYTVMWVLVVVPTWAVHRLVRLSILDDGWAEAGGWRGRGGDAPARRGSSGLRRPGSVEAPAGRGTRAGRGRRAVVFAIVAVVLVKSGLALVGGSGSNTSSTRAGVPIASYAHEHEPWYLDLLDELDQLQFAWDPVLASRPTDARGRYVNVVDGRRASYQPADPDLVVWYFGGSTMFGVAQRDGHTIPSEIARFAERDGISIRSVNNGSMSYVNWQETILLAEMLESEPAPDLIVFYDGVNEMGAAFARAEQGDVDPARSWRLPVASEERELLSASFPETRSRPDDAQVAALGGAQYRRGVDVARTLAAAKGVPIVHVWQPMLNTKPFAPSDATVWKQLGTDHPPLGRDTGSGAREMLAAAHLDGVIDLSRAFDDVHEPIFLDWGHTNELGAQIVAKALYARLRPELERLVDEG